MKWGAVAILKQRPHTRPNQTKRSPAPLFHVVAKEVRETFWLMYSSFVAAFRDAAVRHFRLTGRLLGKERP